MNAASEKNPWTPEWSNAVFSLEERDRRWAKVRGLMARDGVDVIFCLPCTNSHDRGAADARYLTQLGENSDESVVAFPIEGPVTAWHSRGGVWPSSNWFADIRPTPRGTGGATVSAWLNENPRFKNKVAIAGLDSSIISHIRSAEGEVNWQSVDLIKRNFPGAKFVSATPILGEARWRKSAEEIAFLRKGTVVAEAMLETVNRHARPGVRERHIFAHLMYASADADGSFQPMIGWSSGPDGRAYHRLEQPSFRSFKTGDVLLLEIEGRWGGYIAQIDQTWGIGTATPELLDGIKMVFEAFNRVMDKLKPGVTVRELIDAATFTGMNGRARTGLGGHGRGTGDDGPLLVAGRPEPTEVLDLIIEEGCSFAIKPSVALDGIGDFARWGETVAVTAKGAERLGTRPQEMRVLV
jgi:Xaa-Pro aminopeptidase